MFTAFIVLPVTVVTVSVLPTSVEYPIFITFIVDPRRVDWITIAFAEKVLPDNVE
jgi:hypothetical protein